MLSQDFSASGSVRPKYMHGNVLELDHIPPLSRNRRCSKRYETENSRRAESVPVSYPVHRSVILAEISRDFKVVPEKCCKFNCK